MISRVAASEMERAQTKYMLKPVSVVYLGLRGISGWSYSFIGELQNQWIDEASGKAFYKR